MAITLHNNFLPFLLARGFFLARSVHTTFLSTSQCRNFCGVTAQYPTPLLEYKIICHFPSTRKLLALVLNLILVAFLWYM